MATSNSEFGDERFEQYNPHPFQGGYDIQKTYGQSLPPSAQICYPILLSEKKGEDSLETYGSKDFVLPVYNFPCPDREASSDSSQRPAATPFDEVRGSCRMRDHQNPLNWAVDYFFTYFRAFGDKRAEGFSYGNLNYAYEKHQPQESLSIQYNPHESYQDCNQAEENYGFFEEREENRVGLHEYCIPDYGYHSQQPLEGLFGFFDDKRREECSYRRQEVQESLSIQFDPPQNLIYQEMHHYPVDSSGFGADFFKWQPSEESHVEESYTPTYYVESSEDHAFEFDPAVEQKSTDYNYLSNFDFLGIFGTQDGPHSRAAGVEVKFDEKSWEDDRERSWSQRPGNEFDEVSHRFRRICDSNFGNFIYMHLP